MSFQNLLTRKGDGVTGPMSPLLFAQFIARNLEHPNYNLVVRTRFSDPHHFQEYEKGEGWTGYDTLALGIVTEKHMLLTLWVDRGGCGIPIAFVDGTSDDVTLTDAFRNELEKMRLLMPADEEIIGKMLELKQRRHEFAIAL